MTNSIDVHIKQSTNGAPKASTLQHREAKSMLQHRETKSMLQHRETKESKPPVTMQKRSTRTPRTPHEAEETIHAAHAPQSTSTSAASKHTSKSSARSSRYPGIADSSGLRVERRHTSAKSDPLDEIVYERRSSTITNPDGSIVFKMEGAEVPASWSQLATDIVISKYFRKAGINGDKDKGETSVRQVVYRLANTIRKAADDFEGYFATKEDADAFEAELAFLLVNQYGAFNSPVWFNLGLWHQYGIKGSGGNWAYGASLTVEGARPAPSSSTGLTVEGARPAPSSSQAKPFEEETPVVEIANAYERPQCSACFIQAVKDDLMSIYDLVKSEARLFKYGSGTGSNFSSIRGKQEKLSGGGTSSGLMSFLEVFDRAAGATKSGGTTRRAAKMVCLNMDHPEIVDFINWKVREEKKAHALISAGYSADFNGDAYHTISGQNSNNSIRVTDEFMRALETNGKWQTRMGTTGEVCDTYEARDLWRQVADAAWVCADPGVQYDSTINRWHTCPNSGRINASNPCSEYMFLDDTACNLASVNLTKFLRNTEDGKAHSFTQSIDIDGYRHACRVFFIAQEILVDLSSYPTKPIAKNSHDYRPLGLGYANLGSLLMQMGVPYDSDKGRAMAAALTAIMCGEAYAASAEMAASKGAFEGFAKNREPMLRVMKMHREAAYAIHREACPEALYNAAVHDWDRAVKLGEQHGYRNAQATVLAPTGTIGLLMDCDTTGVEPDFALVKFKKLAGGGYFKIVNQSVPNALNTLGYDEIEIRDIVAFVSGTNTLLAAPHINRRTLRERGLTDAELAKVEAAIPGVFELEFAFAPWVIGEDAYERLRSSSAIGAGNGISAADAMAAARIEAKSFSLLEFLGFTRAQIDEANDVIIGRMTIEGAPHLRTEDYAVFDCANRCGKTGKRFLAPMSHVHMMAAVQPFLSGAISKTVNLPNDATVDDVAKIYEEGWRLGLKAVALYRDGCKASQPLSTSAKESKSESASTRSSEPGLLLAPIPKTSAPQEPTQLTLPSPTRPHGLRVRLPKKRMGFTQEARVGGHKIFLRTGEYEDGSLGEIFIDMHKEGAAFRSLMNCFAMSVSIGLQYGVPLETYVDQFTFTRFEPQGVVEGHPNVKVATSIVDYLFRVLGVEYLHRYDLAHVKPDVLDEAKADANAYYEDPTTRELPFPPHNKAAGQEPQLPRAIEVHGARHEGASATSALDAQLEEMMGDAPVCDVCGHITVRNGACYKCLNCGNSMGCS